MDVDDVVNSEHLGDDYLSSGEDGDIGADEISSLYTSDDNDLLEGASHVMGGIFRGKAMGNIPDMADLEQEHMYQPMPQEKGKVLLYTSSDHDAAPMSMNHPVGEKLSSVLHGLGKLYSPMRKANPHIYVEEDETWAMKGRFSYAVRLLEDLPWVKDDKGKFCVSLRADLPGMGSSASGSSGPPVLDPQVLMPSALPVHESEPQSFDQQVITLLGISPGLTTRPKFVEIHLAYAKYLGVLDAQKEMQHMIADGTWTLRTLNSDELVEIFVSKSVWHANYTKLFPQVEKYPMLVKWLENGNDSPSGQEIFGVVKQCYNFKDLRMLLAQLDESAYRKEKRKKHREHRDDRDDGGSRKKHKDRHSSFSGSQGSFVGSLM
jgi:hypothetical protein